MANQFLSLSLFIMLLSFFIILNSMSSFEKIKAQPVLKSLQVAFSSSERDEKAPSYEEDPLEAFREGDTLDKLKALFKSQITSFDAQKNRLGTVMKVTVKVRDFEKGLMAVGASALKEGQLFSASKAFFLPTLVSLMQAEETGIPYRMDMVLLTAENPARMQNEQPTQVLNGLRKVSFFTKRLEDAGLPKKLMTAGLASGREGYMDLYFRRYEPFNPLGNKEKTENNVETP